MLSPQDQEKIARELVKKGFIAADAPGADQLVQNRLGDLIDAFTHALATRKRYRNLNNDLLKACDLALSDPEQDVRMCTILIPIIFSDLFNVDGFAELRTMYMKRLNKWEELGHKELIRILKDVVIPHIDTKTEELQRRQASVIPTS